MSPVLFQPLRDPSSALESTIERIYRRYDPEHDVIPGAPSVTWCDSELADVCLKLVHWNASLQARVEELERRLGVPHE